MKTSLLLALFALSAPGLANDVWTVGPQGSGSDFDGIQAAVDAASSGDLILVNRGPAGDIIYPAFSITAKSLSVRAVAGRQVRVEGALVEGLVPGQTVTLDGLRFDRFESTVRVMDCEGAVRMENCRVVPSGSTPAVELSSALDVSLHGCEVLCAGVAPGLSAELSRVGVYGTSIRGGQGESSYPLSGASVAGDGWPAVFVGTRSFVWLGDCELMGGRGGDAYCDVHGWCDSFHPGDGAPALQTSPGSVVMRLATTLEGGGGYSDDQSVGANGPDEVGISQLVPGDQRRLNAPSSLRDAESGTLRVTGLPGESVELFVAADGWHRFLGWQWGIWFQRTLVGPNPQALGVIPASGVLEANFTLPALHGAASATYALQAVCKTSPTRFRTTPVRMVYALDAEVRSMESEVIHVDHRAAPGGNGRSWERAFSSLELALATAPFGEDRTSEVWVAEGRYAPGGAAADPMSRFHLPGGMRLLGGFRGDEVSSHQRQLGMHETILDGDLNGDDVAFAFDDGSGRSENVRVVVEVNTPNVYYGSFPVTRLDRLTVRGAEARFDHEAGVLVRGDGDMELVDCDLRENNTLDEGAALRHISYTDDSGLTMRRCRVRFNQSRYAAGGIHWASRGSNLIENCAFYGNMAAGASALFIRAASGSDSTRIVSSTFAGNSGFGCALRGYQSHLGSLSITNCILWGGGSGPNEDCHHDLTCGSVGYSTLEFPGAACGMGTNSVQDPLFVDLMGPDGISGTDDDDLRLRPGSPCIDAGDSTALSGGLPLDLNGAPRFVDDPGTLDTGVGGTRVVDHGAFEFQ